MINGTLAVQVFNFFVGYFFLKYIVLKPGLVLMQQRSEKKYQLKRDIAVLRDSIASQVLVKAENWQAFCKKMGSKKPHIEQKGLRDDRMVAADRARLVSTDQESALISAMKKTIIKQVIEE